MALVNHRPIVAWGLIRGGLRMIAHGLFWRLARMHAYEHPESIGYRSSIELPVVGAIAFVPMDEVAPPPVYDW